MIKTTNKEGKIKYYKLKKFIKLLNRGEINVEDVKVKIIKPLHELKKRNYLIISGGQPNPIKFKK